MQNVIKITFFQNQANIGWFCRGWKIKLKQRICDTLLYQTNYRIGNIQNISNSCFSKIGDRTLRAVFQNVVSHLLWYSALLDSIESSFDIFRPEYLKYMLKFSSPFSQSYKNSQKCWGIFLFFKSCQYAFLKSCRN